MTSFRFLLSAVVAFVAIVCCSGATLNATCATPHPQTLYRDFTTAGCGWDCDSLFCSCLGAKYDAVNGTATRSCVVTTAPTCTTLQNCLRNRIVCLNQYATNNGLSTLAPETPSPPSTPAPPTPTMMALPVPVATAVPQPTPAATATATPTEGPASGQCKLSSNTLKVGLLAVAAGLNYAGSSVEDACQNIVCNDYLGGLTHVYATCRNATLEVDGVCKADPVKPSAPAFTAQIRIGGPGIDAAYSNDPAGVTRAIQSDLAKKLGLDFTFVEITSIRIGSLIVDFRVFAAAGTNVAALQSALQALSPNDLSTLSQLTGITLTVDVTAVTLPTGTPTPIGVLDGGDSCGSGCIAGIVVGSFVFVVIVIAVGVLMSKHFSRSSATEPVHAKHEDAHSV